MSKIDAHHHFWKYSPAAHDWITPEMSVIKKDFQPGDLKPIIDAHGIDGVVTVQVDQTESETNALLATANQHEWVKGVVGWVNLSDRGITDRLAYYSDFEKLKGFRHIVQSEPDQRFLLGKDFCNGISHLHAFDFTYDILIYPKHLPYAVEFVKSFTNQPFVIDHLAKPDIKGRELETWSKYMKQLAHCDNVYCKLSGMVTEAKWNAWKYDDFVPYLDVILHAFGTERLMYGSDWPVCMLSATYAQQLNIIETFISTLSETEQQDIMGLNAIKFYSL
jgi:L-fuconolactonase